MFVKHKLRCSKLEERIVLDAAITGDAVHAPTSAPADAAAGSGTAPGGQWSVVGYDLQNTQFNPNERVLSKKDVGLLTEQRLMSDPTGVTGAPIISKDNIIYGVTSGGDAFAVNDITGAEIWRVHLDGESFGNTPAITNDFMIVQAKDLTVLNRHTGEIVWEKNVNISGANNVVTQSRYESLGFTPEDMINEGFHLDANNNIVEQAQNAGGNPAIIHDAVNNRDLVIIGTSSDENYSFVVMGKDGQLKELLPQSDFKGVGQVIAFDLQTGQVAWHVETVDAAAGAAGGGAWASFAYDQSTGLIYTGIGQNHRLASTTPAFDYTDSIIAIKASDGTVAASHQFYKGDVWHSTADGIFPEGVDYDVNTHANLFQAKINGQTVNLVGIGQKSGDYHILTADGLHDLIDLKLDPGAGVGAIQSTPAFHNGLLVMQTMAALEYAGKDPSLAAYVGQMVDPVSGNILVDVGGGYLAAMGPHVGLDNVNRVSLDRFGNSAAPGAPGFSNALQFTSGKTVAVDLDTLMKASGVKDAYKDAIQGKQVATVHLQPTAADKYVNFVNTGDGQAYGALAIVSPNNSQGSYQQDIIFQTDSFRGIRALDVNGNVLWSAPIGADNPFPMTTGGATIDDNGNIYVNFGYGAGGGIEKFSLPISNKAAPDINTDPKALGNALGALNDQKNQKASKK